MCSQKLSVFIISFFLLSIVFFCVSTTSFATAPQITASPSGALSLDTSFIVSATMSGLSKGAIYRLRIALAQPGTSNYFGSTYNGSFWYNGTPSPIIYANFLSITTDGNGAWSGSIQGEIDSDDPNFTTGSGTYDLKVGRYTQTGSSATWSDPISVSIVLAPTPTSLPTNTPTPIPTPTPTITFITPTPTPKISSPTKSANPTISMSVSPTNVASASSDVLASSTSALSPSEALVAAAGDKKVVDILPLLIAVAGGILLAVCGILFALPKLKERFYAKHTTDK